MVHKELSKKLPPLIKHKLSKKVQETDDKIKSNLQTTNHNWNGCRFQKHWNMLEWVNTRSKILIIIPIQPLQRNTILINMIEWLIGFSIQN